LVSEKWGTFEIEQFLTWLQPLWAVKTVKCAASVQGPLTN
jgi:hypothetical protein